MNILLPCWYCCNSVAWLALMVNFSTGCSLQLILVSTLTLKKSLINHGMSCSWIWGSYIYSLPNRFIWWIIAIDLVRIMGHSYDCVWEWNSPSVHSTVMTKLKLKTLVSCVPSKFYFVEEDLILFRYLHFCFPGLYWNYTYTWISPHFDDRSKLR